MKGARFVPQSHSDPHARLRDDVRRLGELLGEVLAEQGGPALLETVERVRALSKADRASDPISATRLLELLGDVPLDQAVPLARAFSHFLALSNMAEQHHRIRRRRDYRANPSAPAQRGSFADCFQRMTEAGVATDAIREHVNSLRVELVLTAHPTEINRRTNLRRHLAIARLLDARDRERGDPVEHARDRCPART